MLTRDDLLTIADRYHRTDWSGFDPTVAVFDIGRLMGQSTLQAERIAVLDAAARAVVDAHSSRSDGVLIACGCPTDAAGRIPFHPDTCLVTRLELLLEENAR